MLEPEALIHKNVVDELDDNSTLSYSSVLFIDCEASSLADRSYPIEIAWGSHAQKIESFLINPISVSSWTDWDQEAQDIHGISAKQLQDEGVDPNWLCDYMNDQLSGKTLYSDAPYFDWKWVHTLFQACGKTMSFTVEDAILHMLQLLSPENTINGQGQLQQILKVAKREIGKAHRATWDVEYLLLGWQRVNEAKSHLKLMI